MKKCVVSAFLIAGSFAAFAQNDPEAEANPNSLYKIPVYEQVYKVRVWRDMDLKEKQNKGFFAMGNEITGILIQAIKSGEIANVYKNDSLLERSKKTKQEFMQSFQMTLGQTFPAWDASTTYTASNPDRVNYNGKDYEALQDNTGMQPDTSPNDWVETKAGQPREFTARDIFRLEIMEDLIFDKRRSRLYYDVLGIQMMGWDDQGQIFKPLGWLKYKDVEKVFRAHPDKAIWFNRQNTAQNRNFADAILLRLFHASIKKVENPDDNTLTDIYSGDIKMAVMAREWEEMRLMEKEHNLWEY